MQVQTINGMVQKTFHSRRHAMNTLEALHPNATPPLFSIDNGQGEQIYVAQYEKMVALVEGVEYTVIKIEDPQENIENAE